MNVCEGDKFCISVKALYEMDKPLYFGTIVPDFAKGSNDCDYYDLYNEDGELACLDGEEVMVDQVGSVLVTLRNDNGDGTVYFALTRDELDIAIIG